MMAGATNITLIRTDRGRRLKLARAVQTSPEDAWERLSEVVYWTSWGPLLTDVRYPHESVREDTTGNVQLMNCFWIPFRVQNVENYYWTWTVYGMTPPSDGHGVEPLGEDACRVSFELPVWGVPYLPVCYFALRTIQRSIEAADR